MHIDAAQRSVHTQPPALKEMSALRLDSHPAALQKAKLLCCSQLIRLHLPSQQFTSCAQHRRCPHSWPCPCAHCVLPSACQ